MRGVVLAGGTGSRLLPLTKATNKHLLPVAGKPMIYHPIERLIQAGINKILIVTGTEHMGAVVQCLGSGRDFGATFSYKVQDMAGGIAQALALAEDFCRHKICVVLGDNIFQDDISYMVNAFANQNEGARILLKKVDDPNRYGVAYTTAQKISTIIEKPTEIPDDVDPYAVTGIYFYDTTVFNVIRKLQPSARGELEITDVNQYYLDQGQLVYSMLHGEWTDAGTLTSLALADRMAL